MRFAQKITLLIGGCVLVLGVLCLIQYRLVRNTYRLEEAAFFRQVERQLESKSQGLSDSLNKQVMKALLNKLQDQLGRGMPPDLTGFQEEVDQVAAGYRHLIRQAFLQDELLRKTELSLAYTRVILYHGQEADTLLREAEKPLLLTGKGKGVFLLSVGKQQTGFAVQPFTPNGQTTYYRLAVWNRPSINAVDWQQLVLGRMSATLGGSAALIAALVLIFFLIFSALLRQKKIADVTTDFANNMTHEMKTPLSAAALVVKSLRTPDATLDEVWFEELLGQLDRQHMKIQRLMDQVLTTALDRPISAVQLKPFKLKPLFDDLSLLATAAGRELAFTGQTGSVIYSDPDVLNAILSNLLDNALKYTPPGSPLVIDMETLKDKIRISVKDSGPGIEKKYQRYLFQKFFRVPRADSGQVKGLGLGLFLCRIQAQQLNGKLSYQRSSSSGGSIFTLTLPDEKDPHITC